MNMKSDYWGNNLESQSKYGCGIEWNWTISLIRLYCNIMIFNYFMWHIHIYVYIQHFSWNFRTWQDVLRSCEEEEKTLQYSKECRLRASKCVATSFHSVYFHNQRFFCASLFFIQYTTADNISYILSCDSGLKAIFGTEWKITSQNWFYEQEKVFADIFSFFFSYVWVCVCACGVLKRF